MTLPSFKSQSDFFNRSVSRVGINKPAWRLGGNGMFFIGSCFADYLYREYEAAELNAMSAPFGSIYNPESLAEAASMLSGDAAAIQAADCFRTDAADRHFRHFMFHSRINGKSADELAEDLNKRTAAARNYIKTAEAIVITLGTSLVYRLKNGGTVSNCHKLPASDFDRVQLDTAEAAAALFRAVECFRKLNTDLKFIISLSPVRHLRDNAAENSLSKAVLRCAIAEVEKKEPTSSAWYFPSYEIMLDELRDYRWYGDDLCHPSEKAVSYIISRFIESVYDDNFNGFIEQYSSILKDLNHRPLNPESAEYRQFKEKAEEKKAGLKTDYPGLFI